MTRVARIVLLNGPGSVGKSTVALAMQALATAPLLHLSMDRFCEMLPEQYQDHPDTFRFATQRTGGATLTEVVIGPAGAALLHAMRVSAAALADAGFDLVIDDVWLDGEPVEYQELLVAHRVWRVGLTAPLDLLEAREAGRPDRAPGLSRAQVGTIHHGVCYDLMMDMSITTPSEAARRIVAMAGL